MRIHVVRRFSAAFPRVSTAFEKFSAASVIAILIAVAVLGSGARLVSQAPVSLKPKLDSPQRLEDWTLDGNGTWSIADGALVLSKEGVPGGKIRRPAALAILKSDPFARVTMELDVKSTAPADLKVRDVNLIVGYESPTRFYYVHLSAVTDGVHNGIFVVADADRRRIDSGKGVAMLKDQAWHRVRVDRDPSTGRIEVFFDGSPKPILEATDTTIRTGRVGFGSFDETGEFRNVVVTGTAAH